MPPALLLGLTACADSIGAVSPPQIAKLPKQFAADCDDPVLIPNRELPQAEVEYLWASDRRSLANCRDLHSQTVGWVQKRDKAIGNGS